MTTTPDHAITLLKRDILAENQVYQVCFDHIRTAQGQEAQNFLSVVPHTLTAERLGGVAVLPIAQGRIGLLKVWRHPLGAFGWEIPRGFIDVNETAEVAALRELQEEMGLQATAAQLQPLGNFAPEAALLQARVALFAVHLDECAGTLSDEAGHCELRWFPAAEFIALLANGDIEDAATNIAWLRVLLSLAPPGE